MIFGERATVLSGAAVALAFALAGCGSAGTGAPTSTAHDPAAQSAETPTGATAQRGPGGILKSDGDNDADEQSKAIGSDDQVEMVEAARRNTGASPADRRAIEELVKRYFAAAAAGDGASACPLLVPSLATATGEQVANPGAGQSRCAASLSHLYAQQHSHLAALQVPTMTVTGVHVDGAVGYVTLGFRQALESEVLVQRESGVWKLDALLDSKLP